MGRWPEPVRRGPGSVEGPSRLCCAFLHGCARWGLAGRAGPTSGWLGRLRRSGPVPMRLVLK